MRRLSRRRSIRLKGYDYATPGAYFVTICTYRRELLLGHVEDGVVRLNGSGCLVQAAWEDLPNHYSNILLDAFVVMPNHIHGVLVLKDEGASSDRRRVGAGFKPASTRRALPEMVRGFKTHSARRVNDLLRTRGRPVWQRGYYEHVIRDDASLNRIREYILHNPESWAIDRENPWRDPSQQRCRGEDVFAPATP
jgi:REP element-mobilizing transposase RayT